MTEAQGRVGRWLRNKWHLDSLIAIGGMAAVYSSTHRNGARAAIKMLHSQYTRNEQARRRFLAEGYAANKVGHRNAVLVLDDDATEDGEVYLVMELLDGESLEGRLERLGVMGPMEVLAITDQLLEVLACAHPKGILHRDIKPANIYLTRDGAVKLLDFGLARVRELSAEAMDQSDGIVFGTVSYIAPEQARADNQNLDARSDMWSIAATMFRALSGETVHPSTGPVIDRLMAVARKPPRSIASVVPHLPRPVIELVDRALAFDPENRWPSANVMRVVVQDVMAQLREEAEAQGGDDEMTGMFARPPLGSGIASSHRTAAELPAVRSGRTAPVGEPQPRPKTDPVALTTRPKSLPDLGEIELEVDLETAPRPEQKGRRSRTLLTKEGRAELRRILDARKGGDGKSDESTPSPVVGSPSAAESGVGDIDVEVEDSIIEVTIDHTHRGRSGAIAESLADNTTPAPVRADRATGSFAAVPEDKAPASQAAPQMHASRATGGFTAVPEDRRPTPTTPTIPTIPTTPTGPASRASAAPVAPDRHSASTASYPTLGGATSKPIQPPTRAAPVPTRMTARDEDITQVAPAPSSASAEATKSLSPISGEIGVRGPAEITRVGPPPAPARGGPPPRPLEPPRPESTLHDTLRPKTIPPVSSRTSGVGRPGSAEAQPAPTPAPVKPDAKPPQKSAAPVEAIPAPGKPPEATPTQGRTDTKREAVKTEPDRVEPEPGPTGEAPRSTPRAGMFAAPPSRTVTPVVRNSTEALPPRVVANPSEPVRSPAPAPGLTGLPSRVVSRPGALEPPQATKSVSPARPTATPASPAAPAPAVASPAAPVSPAPRSSQDVAPIAPAPSAVPGLVGPPPASLLSSRAPASSRTEPPPAVPVEPEPATRDSAAAGASAATASHPIVPADEAGPREPKLKAGAPVLPFSFLRPGPTTRPGEAPSEPPPGSVPPRKKP